MERNEVLDFYISQIQDNFIPYWSNFVDKDNGGIFNCINNFGDKKINNNKFTWSQGRYLWILGKLYELNQGSLFLKINNKHIKEQMDKTFSFIEKYAIYDNKCSYLLDEFGKKILDENTKRYDASIFADCFVLIGMAQYARSLNKKEKVGQVKRLYDSIVRRIKKGEFLTEPYPIPEGHKVHSIPMIMINTSYEYIKMLQKFGLEYETEVAYGLQQIDIILGEFYRDGLIREHLSTEENYENCLLDRHVNPGHTLEDMWFIIEFLDEFGDLDNYLAKIMEISQKTYDLGWDKKYGGLLRFVDRDGTIPHGICGNSDYEKLIRNTHDMKLWWPHSEILYLSLLLYELTGNKEMLRNYKRSFNYVFRTFPNEEIGEWIQIRRRDGTPQDKLVALPVKDPFHILRDFIKIIELFES